MMKKSLKIMVLLFIMTVLFSGCTDLFGAEEISFEVTAGEATVKSVPNETALTEVIIPDTYEGVPVTSIKDFAVVNLEFVTKVKIGKNVKQIGEWALTNNQALAEYEVDPENEYFCDVDGVLYTKDLKTLVAYPLAKGLEDTTDKDGNTNKRSSYEILDGVETIRTKAFYKCQFLQHITVPDTVKVIGEKAFFRCSALEEFDMPENIQVIEKDAFSYCSLIKDMSISSSVNSIGEYAFFNCNSLKRMDIDKKEGDITLGKKWYPTNNGLDMDDLVINWSK